MVMPRSRSMSMESSTCSTISRSVSPPVSWISRSAKVDLPWSICATIEKLRMLSMAAAVMARGLAPGAAERQASPVSVRAVRVPCPQQCGFFVGCEPGQRDIRPGMPGERVAGGLLEASHREAGLARRGGIASHEPGKFRQRQPQRQRARTGPAPYVLRLQEGIVDPDERTIGADGAGAFREKFSARERRADTVIATDAAHFGAAHDPLREVAHIDELHRIIRRAGRQHLAAT